jgi:NAD(P)H-dependent flavin oxidoreductase YrpB (nitropropane dioxygenase family)
VIAAGGVADGRGRAAVLVLGVDAAWVGTRFLMAQEANVHDEWRRRIRDASETSTVYGTVFDGGWPDSPHRALRNSTAQAWESAGRPAAPERPGGGDVVARAPDGGCLYRYGAEIPVRGAPGDVRALAHHAGQSAGVGADVRPAASIVDELVRGAAETLLSVTTRR